MREWLAHYGIPVCVIATKADKVARSKRDSHIRTIREAFQIKQDEKFIVFSAEDGMGKEEVWNWIEDHLKNIVKL
jgi:GTP-binding protein